MHGRQMQSLETIFHHVISDTTNVSVDLSKGRTVAEGGVMDTEDECLACAENDDTLGRLAVFFASALNVGGATFVIVNLTAGESVSLTGDCEATFSD